MNSRWTALTLLNVIIVLAALALVLYKDNPSGDPDKDDRLLIPITF